MSILNRNELKNTKERPVILKRKLVAKTQLFEIEALHIRFSTGVERRHERLKEFGHATVLIVPLQDPETMLLIREYSAGTNRYELVFPTGKVKLEESIYEAANRELKEEIGFGSNRLSMVKTLQIAPGHFDHKTHIVLAEDLYPEKLSGDEPEPIDVFSWPIANSVELIHTNEFREARSVAALLIVKNLIDKQ